MPVDDATSPAADDATVPAIPAWARVLIVLTVVIVWGVAVLYSLLVLHTLPDAAWTLVPSAVIAAIAPPWRVPGRRGPQ